MDNKEKLTVSELLLYYEERYDIKFILSDTGGDQEKNSCRQFLVRLLKDTKPLEFDPSLWDMMGESKGVKKISIKTFEKYCFLRWHDHIRKSFEDRYNEMTLRQDFEKYQFDNKEYWEKEANELIVRQNEAIESGDNLLELHEPSNSVAEEESFLSRSDLIGIKMMLQAILLEGCKKEFCWDRLTYDLEKADIPSGSAYNPSIGWETARALSRLKDFRNYIKNSSLDRT